MNGTDERERLQERLRASLHERAGDITSTPALWELTEERARRGRRRLVLLSALGAAAVVATVVVAGPALLQSDGQTNVFVDDPTPTPTTIDGTPLPVAGRPDYVLAAQGTMLTAFDVTSGEVARWQADLGRVPTRLALRPGTSDDRPIVAWATVGDDGWQVGVSEIDTASGQVRDLFVEQASSGLPLDEVVVPGPAWSPDGRDVAWVQTIADLGPVTSQLRVQTLDGTDMIGNASHALTGDTTTVRGRAGVASWAWNGERDGLPLGEIVLVGDGRIFTLMLPHAPRSAGDAAVGIDGPQEYDPMGALFDVAWDGTRQWALLRSSIERTEPVAHFDVVAWDGSGEVLLADVGPFPPTEGADLSVVGGVVTIASGGEVRTIAADRPDELLLSLQDQSAGWHGVALPMVTVAPGRSAPTPPAPSPDATMDEAIRRSDALPGMVVTADGQQVRVARSDGATIAMYDIPIASEASWEIVGLDVRPGSTEADATMALLLALDDRPHLAWARLRDGAITAAEFDRAYQPWANEAFLSVDGEMPVPRFSGDGRFVGWVETGPDGERTLRSVGWLPGADAPGTGRTADDNAAFGLGPGAGTLEYWSNPMTSRSGGEGSFVLISNADGTTSTCEFEHQGDGALALTLCEADVATDRTVVALTDWAALVDEGSSLALRRLDDLGGEPLPLPNEVAAATSQAARSGTWLARAGANAVFVGFEGRAWLVTVEGAQELDGTIATIAAVG